MRLRAAMQLAVLVALVLAGIVLIALPDSDDRIITLSPEHGPAALDLLGSILLVAGWLGIVARPVATRRSVAGRMGTAARGLCLFLAGVGVGLLVASIFSQLDWWWMVGAGVLAALQVYLVVLSVRAKAGARPHDPHPV